MNDELVVYDMDRSAVHLLNPVAAFVWTHCDGQSTVAQLAALLRDELELPASDDVVLLALDDLERNCLLEEAQPAPPEPRSFSRRQALKRLAATTGIGLVLPLIESLHPPSAHAAASLPLGDCTKFSCRVVTRNGTVECLEECPPPCKCRVVNRVVPPETLPRPTCECYRPLPPGSDCGSWDANGNLICRSPCPGRKICRTVLTGTEKRCVCMET